MFLNNFFSGWTGKQRRGISLRQSPDFSFVVSHLRHNAIQLVDLLQGESVNIVDPNATSNLAIKYSRCFVVDV